MSPGRPNIFKSARLPGRPTTCNTFDCSGANQAAPELLYLQVHPSVLKTLNMATELLLTRLVKDMMYASHMRSKQAQSVPGFEAKDDDRFWAQKVRVVASHM